MSRRDHRRRLGAAPAAVTRAGLLVEQVAHVQAELAGERPQGAHARVNLVALDLRDQAGRDADRASERAEAEPRALALPAELGADVRRRVRLRRSCVRGHCYAEPRESQSRSNRYEWRSGGPGAEVSSHWTVPPFVSENAWTQPTAVQNTSPGCSAYRVPSATTSTSPSSM